ncbi:MAG: TonB-dependent receptor [Bacteroidales bacterium]|nr:TonB-dependent receptor [Bacteroidales bacterium]
MKCILFFIFIATGACFASKSYSQKTRFTMEYDNCTLREVIREIEQKSEFIFFYLDNSIDLERKVSIRVRDGNIETILEQLFAGTNNRHYISDRQIILSKDRESATVPSTIPEPVVEQSGKRIRGTVVDASGEPVIGANITEKGVASNGTITNADGKFSLDVSPGATLTVSYIGYVTQEIAVGTQTQLQITLQEDLQALEEVVVVGYGTQKKITLTGSVVAVSGEKVLKTPSGTLGRSLAGRLPGVRVRDVGGRPGEDATVDVRGFKSGSGALIVVDGIEQSGFHIDPNEIESISVLKDATAAIYGNNASGGVILITTKPGVSGDSRIRYSGSVGFQNLTVYPEMVDAAGFAELTDESDINMGGDPTKVTYGADRVQKYREGTDPAYRSYDWADYLLRENAPMTQHNLSARGGSEKIKYFSSLGYLSQKSLYSSGNMGYERYNFRTNLSAKIAERLTFDTQLGGHVQNTHGPYNGDDNIYGAGIQGMHPDLSPWANDDERIHYSNPGNKWNSLAMADEEVAGYNNSEKTFFTGQFALKYDLPFVKGLSFKALYSYRLNTNVSRVFAKEFFQYGYNRATDTYAVTQTVNTPSNLTRQDEQTKQYLWRFSADYARKFAEKHNVEATLVYEQKEDLYEYLSAYRQFDIDALDQINAGAKNTSLANGGSQSENATASFVGRINYDYAQKYLLTLLARYDGSALFDKDHRWGLFPGALVGWRISEESFVKDNTAILDNLKLRLSWGKMGDVNGVNGFSYLTGYNYPGYHYYYFDSSKPVNSLDYAGLANPTLTWPESEIYNAGLDFSLWNRKLEGSADVFSRRQTGTPATRNMSLPNTFGVSMPQENLNGTETRGFELVLGHTNEISDVWYSIQGNLTWARTKNKYIEQAAPINSYSNWNANRSERWENIVYGYKCLGQFQDQQDINGWAIQDGNGNRTLMPGDLKFEDLNGDHVINSLDEQPIGRSSDPEVYFGLDLSAEWKGFDLSLLFQGATNYSLDVPNYGLVNGGTAYTIYLDRWRRADPYDPNSAWIPGTYPSTWAGGKQSNSRVSDFNIVDMYYVRLKSLELGYSLPKKWLNTLRVHDVRLYISGMNLFTIHPHPYSDPETPGWYYPITKTGNFGVNLTF